LIAIGFVSGIAAGTLAWRRAQHNARRALFSRSPFRRVAALSYLKGRPTIETVRLLREYIGWEPRRMLRRRGLRLLKTVETELE